MARKGEGDTKRSRFPRKNDEYNQFNLPPSSIRIKNKRRPPNVK